MKIIFSKNAPRDVAKMLYLIKLSKYFLLISSRFFGHFNQKINVKLILNIAQLIFNLVKFNTYSHAVSPNSVRSKNRYIYSSQVTVLACLLMSPSTALSYTSLK